MNELGHLNNLSDSKGEERENQLATKRAKSIKNYTFKRSFFNLEATKQRLKNEKEYTYNNRRE